MGEKAWRPKRWARVPSFQCFSHLGYQMFWSIGRGLDSFAYSAPVEQRGGPFQWARLAVSPDWDNTGICALGAMKNVFPCWQMHTPGKNKQCTSL